MGIYIDWSITAPEEEPWFDDMVSKGFPETVEAITKHGIRLSNMYTGPQVKNGKPRVNIRTTLRPKGGLTSYKGSSRDESTHIYESAPTLLGELESDKIQSSITAIATSRATPHILVGTRDDSIIVITPSYVGSQRQKRCRERRRDQKARLKEIKSEEGELFSANFYGKDNSINGGHNSTTAE